VSGLFSNPEFLRYSRSQLRTNKMIAAAIVCVALSLTIGFSILHSGGSQYQSRSREESGNVLLMTAFLLQTLALAIGGGIACLNSIYTEKEQNTFDYQRITRLSAVEMTLGKLFGAPILMYFICLCLTPLTIYAAIVAHTKPTLVLAGYVVLLVASLTFHTLTLLLSLVTVKGSQVSSILLALLVLWVASIDFGGGYLRLHTLGPFEAQQIATAKTWETITTINLPNGKAYVVDQFADVFFGQPVHHFPVLVSIDLILALWFLLAVVRNIKKDPQQYEAYSPVQFLLFALFLNFLFVGFYNRSWASPVDAQSIFLTFDLAIFTFLGIALLRNRERMRGLARITRQPAMELWNTLWPAPVLAIGTILAGLLIVTGLSYSHSPSGNWSLGFAVLRALVFVLWVVSNLQFLQLMNLRQGKHPLVMAVLYLSVYYVCASVLFTAMGCFLTEGMMPVGSLFLPSGMFLLEPRTWGKGPALWVSGMILQVVLTGLFFYLQGREIRNLQRSLTAAV
jgi:hypothetical protein